MALASTRVSVVNKLSKWLPPTTFPQVSSLSFLHLWETVQDQQVSDPFKPPMLLLWLPEHSRICVYPLRVKSLFPTTYGSPESKLSWPSKLNVLGDHFSWFRTLRLENLMWNLDPLFLWEILCNCNYPLIVGCPLRSIDADCSVMSFPGNAHGKESTCQCRRYKRHSFDPCVWKIPWRKKWLPTPVFLPRESHGQRNLVGYSSCSRKMSDVAGPIFISWYTYCISTLPMCPVMIPSLYLSLNIFSDRFPSFSSIVALSVHFSSVTQSCLTLCDPLNHSTPGLPVHHQLLEFTQTHVQGVDDAIQPSHPLLSPSPPAPSPFQHQGLFQ